MSILKKIVEFIRSQLSFFMTKHTTIEQQYAEAANKIIDKINQLRKRYATSKKEISRLKALADEKDQNAASKEREIRHLMQTQPTVDVTTHAKLGLLYRRTAAALRTKASELVAMQEEIERTTVALDDQRADLAVKLEFIRESNAANSMGLSTADDIIETAELAKVDVDTIISRIDTFNGSNATGVESTSADLAEYLESLKA
ncbi:Hypothetical protein KNT65_gp147 [Escherichia phage EcS1]|uniref:Uncharacterized protein n=1 Tax=Escherichia phage EcS1 TaxID=2083276 RepID=A0A2Z5ZCJ2_9CAUD|nr:Hypothetical protein KNT65_gp147 [Escherichia phage EcS1]BBC78195.1 Hypothetical protein [Escherichia phage EcS1]